MLPFRNALHGLFDVLFRSLFVLLCVFMGFSSYGEARAGDSFYGPALFCDDLLSVGFIAENFYGRAEKSSPERGLMALAFQMGRSEMLEGKRSLEHPDIPVCGVLYSSFRSSVEAVHTYHGISIYRLRIPVPVQQVSFSSYIYAIRLDGFEYKLIRGTFQFREWTTTKQAGSAGNE